MTVSYIISHTLKQRCFGKKTKRMGYYDEGTQKR